MVYSNVNRITKQWWGATHFRLGSRNQPRPNKGFNINQFKNVGEAIEYCRWWKRLRRGNLSQVLNSITKSKSSDKILTAKDIADVESGNKELSVDKLSILGRYLGVDLIKSKRHGGKYKFI